MKTQKKSESQYLKLKECKKYQLYSELYDYCSCLESELKDSKKQINKMENEISILNNKITYYGVKPITLVIRYWQTGGSECDSCCDTTCGVCDIGYDAEETVRVLSYEIEQGNDFSSRTNNMIINIVDSQFQDDTFYDIYYVEDITHKRIIYDFDKEESSE